jgi:hypothetical protein
VAAGAPNVNPPPTLTGAASPTFKASPFVTVAAPNVNTSVDEMDAPAAESSPNVNAAKVLGPVADDFAASSFVSSLFKKLPPTFPSLNSLSAAPNNESSSSTLPFFSFERRNGLLFSPPVVPVVPVSTLKEKIPIAAPGSGAIDVSVA